MKEKISRQRKWQLKKKAQGLCIICGKPAVNSRHCEQCYVKQKELRRRYSVKWRKRNKAKITEYNKKYYAKNRKKLLEQKRKNRAEKKEQS